MATAKPKSKPRKSRKKPAAKPNGFLRRWFWRALLFSMVVVAIYVYYLDYTVREQFEGKRWELPARVFANPVELYPGYDLSLNKLDALLDDLGYHLNTRLTASGMYARSGSHISLRTRAFQFWDGVEPARTVQIRFNGNRVQQITDLDSQRDLALLRLDPVQVGSFYPTRKEDRILVKIDEVPQTLVDGLIAVEDRNFFRHHGVSIKSIARAMLANIQAGSVVQGGSTLTQQLVKNFYLTSERSLWRKAKEAAMALILDARYDKKEILEAYLNEVFLGQDGGRAIHGFGMASVFYFNRPLVELKPHHVALLVGMVKGPSYYDPRQHPERALQRRNLVIAEMEKLGYLPKEQADIARRQRLDVTQQRRVRQARYPAFLDLVRRQLSREYRDEDLTSEGLRIFSTLDYEIQNIAERVFERALDSLSAGYSIPKGQLQGAMVITRREGGELVAVIGDRNPKYDGFNRALDAERPIGSLVKPAVYLTALENSSRYNIVSPLSDEAVQLKLADGSLWEPQNYDKTMHGIVPLHEALSHSYNLATVHLGMDVKVHNVVRTLERMGITRPIKPYPSLLLGAVAMTPVEVTQMYQTLAGEGFTTPLRSIQSVVSNQNEPLQRYPLTVQQSLNPSAVYVLNTILQETVRSGTAASAYTLLSPQLNLAGKTGTTDDLRDSWFAGFSGDYLAVVWLGRDDNKPAHLTGTSGALQVWANVMREIARQPVQLTPTEDIEYVWIDQGLRANGTCPNALQYPFIRGSAPETMAPCVGPVGEMLDRAGRWLNDHWNKR